MVSTVLACVLVGMLIGWYALFHYNIYVPEHGLIAAAFALGFLAASDRVAPVYVPWALVISIALTGYSGVLLVLEIIWQYWDSKRRRRR